MSDNYLDNWCTLDCLAEECKGDREYLDFDWELEQDEDDA